MTQKELEEFLEQNPSIKGFYREDESAYYFHHTLYDEENEALRVEKWALEKLTPEKLLALIEGGRNVEHITRVTGYFSKVEGWNKGKKGELKDRYRSGGQL